MANPPFPFVSVYHYKPFPEEVCDNWDTLREKMRARYAKLPASIPAAGPFNELSFLMIRQYLE
jgi:hypothetical protein